MSFPTPGQGQRRPQTPAQFDVQAIWDSGKLRWVALTGVSALVAVISVLLPWATVSVELFGIKESESLSGFEGVGKVTIFFAIAAVALAVVGLLNANLRAASWFSSLLSSFTGALIILPIYDVFDVSKAAKELTDVLGDDASASVGIGLWLALLSGGAAAAFATINLMVEKGKLAPNFGGTKAQPSAVNTMGAAMHVPTTPFTARQPQAPGFPVPGQPVAGQPMPVPGQPVPGQPMPVPGQPVPGQPMPGVAPQAPQQSFPQAPQQQVPGYPVPGQPGAGVAPQAPQQGLPQAPQQPQPPVNPQG